MEDENRRPEGEEEEVIVDPNADTGDEAVDGDEHEDLAPNPDVSEQPVEQSTGAGEEPSPATTPNDDENNRNNRNNRPKELDGEQKQGFFSRLKEKIFNGEGIAGFIASTLLSAVYAIREVLRALAFGPQYARATQSDAAKRFDIENEKEILRKLANEQGQEQGPRRDGPRDGQSIGQRDNPTPNRSQDEQGDREEIGDREEGAPAIESRETNLIARLIGEGLGKDVIFGLIDQIKGDSQEDITEEQEQLVVAESSFIIRLNRLETLSGEEKDNEIKDLAKYLEEHANVFGVDNLLDTIVDMYDYANQYNGLTENMQAILEVVKNDEPTLGENKDKILDAIQGFEATTHLDTRLRRLLTKLELDNDTIETLMTRATSDGELTREKSDKTMIVGCSIAVLNSLPSRTEEKNRMLKDLATYLVKNVDVIGVENFKQTLDDICHYYTRSGIGVAPQFYSLMDVFKDRGMDLGPHKDEISNAISQCTNELSRKIVLLSKVNESIDAMKDKTYKEKATIRNDLIKYLTEHTKDFGRDLDKILLAAQQRVFRSEAKTKSLLALVKDLQRNGVNLGEHKDEILQNLKKVETIFKQKVEEFEQKRSRQEGEPEHSSPDGKIEVKIGMNVEDANRLLQDKKIASMFATYLGMAYDINGTNDKMKIAAINNPNRYVLINKDKLLAGNAMELARAMQALGCSMKGVEINSKSNIAGVVYATQAVIMTTLIKQLHSDKYLSMGYNNPESKNNPMQGDIAFVSNKIFAGNQSFNEAKTLTIKVENLDNPTLLVQFEDPQHKGQIHTDKLTIEQALSKDSILSIIQGEYAIMGQEQAMAIERQIESARGAVKGMDSRLDGSETTRKGSLFGEISANYLKGITPQDGEIESQFTEEDLQNLMNQLNGEESRSQGARAQADDNIPKPTDRDAIDRAIAAEEAEEDEPEL